MLKVFATGGAAVKGMFPEDGSRELVLVSVEIRKITCTAKRAECLQGAREAKFEVNAPYISFSRCEEEPGSPGGGSLVVCDMVTMYYSKVLIAMVSALLPSMRVYSVNYTPVLVMQAKKGFVENMKILKRKRVMRNGSFRDRIFEMCKSGAQADDVYREVEAAAAATI